MNEKIIDTINNILSKYSFFELMILSIDGSELTLAGSEDFSYYYNLTISFKNIHTILICSHFKVNTTKPVIILIDNTEEAYMLNREYKVTIGNSSFKLISEDNISYY